MSGLKRISYTHEAMIDLIIQRPDVTSKELAEVFGYSQAWVASILSSDSFAARLAQRRSALVDPIISNSLRERFGALAIRSVDVLQHKLDSEESASLALEAFGISTAALNSLPRGA